MTTFQIIMLAIISAGLVASVGFSLAFVVEAIRGPRGPKVPKAPKQPKQVEEKEENNIGKMLAQLELETEMQQEASKDIYENVVEQEAPVLVSTTKVEEPKEEIEETVVEENEPISFSDEDESVAFVDEDESISFADEDEEEPEAPKTVIIEKVTTETVGTDFDYNVRLAKIIESKNKMERDLQKTKRAITKYERTQRRRARNQRMLDRRAVELTNLNLMMYSVTDIKNVDAEKKEKQKELTTHIAELKASIQDADLFLEKNKERYEHDKKMFAFYTKEELRYNDEIKELEILIKNANSVTGTTTTTTTTTTTETV